MKIVFVGDTAVGKTCLIQRYVNDRYRETAQPTIAPMAERATHRVKSGSNVDLTIWDTAGQEQYQALSTQFFRNATVACICYDPMNQSSAFSVQEWMGKVVAQCNECQVVLVATKCDQYDDIPTPETRPERVAEYNDIKQLFVTSAKEGAGVDFLFESIAEFGDKGALNAATPTAPKEAEVASPDRALKRWRSC
jgi:small GTP-binding protein